MRSKRFILWLALGLVLLFYALPIYVMVVNGLKEATNISMATMWTLPRQLSTGGFAEAWAMLSPNMRNSLVMVVPAAIISSMIGAVNGYVFSKWRFWGSEFLFALLLFGFLSPTKPFCCHWCVSCSGSDCMARCPDLY